MTDPKQDAEQEKSSDSKPLNASEGEKTQEQENIPFHEHPRFKELIEEKNSLKASLDEMKEQFTNSRHKQEEDEEIPDVISNPKEFLNYTFKKFKETSERETSAAQAEEAKEIQKIEGQLLKLREGGAQFEREKFLEFIGEYEIEDIDKAYKLYSKFNDSNSDAEQKKVDEKFKSIPKKKAQDIDTKQRAKLDVLRRKSFSDVIADEVAKLNG